MPEGGGVRAASAATTMGGKRRPSLIAHATGVSGTGVDGGS